MLWIWQAIYPSPSDNSFNSDHFMTRFLCKSGKLKIVIEKFRRKFTTACSPLKTFCRFWIQSARRSVLLNGKSNFWMCPKFLTLRMPPLIVTYEKHSLISFPVNALKKFFLFVHFIWQLLFACKELSFLQQRIFVRNFIHVLNMKSRVRSNGRGFLVKYFRKKICMCLSGAVLKLTVHFSTTRKGELVI